MIQINSNSKNSNAVVCEQRSYGKTVDVQKDLFWNVLALRFTWIKRFRGETWNVKRASSLLFLKRFSNLWYHFTDNFLNRYVLPEKLLKACGFDHCSWRLFCLFVEKNTFLNIYLTGEEAGWPFLYSHISLGSIFFWLEMTKHNFFTQSNKMP